MAEEDSESKSIVLFKFLRDWWSYLRGPATFLSTQDLSSNAALKHATKYLLYGLSGVIAFSALNLKLSVIAWSDETRKLFEGRILVIALFQSCLIIAFISHMVALLLKGQGGWRQVYASFALTLGFLWPSVALALIVTAWVFQLLVGVPITALPPFDIQIGGLVAQTTGNVLLIAALMTLYGWMTGYLLYCYGCTIWTAHQLSPLRAGVAVATALIVVNVFNTPIAGFVTWTAEKLEPLFDWIEKLL